MANKYPQRNLFRFWAMALESYNLDDLWLLLSKILVHAVVGYAVKCAAACWDQLLVVFKGFTFASWWSSDLRFDLRRSASDCWRHHSSAIAYSSLWEAWKSCFFDSYRNWLTSTTDYRCLCVYPKLCHTQFSSAFHLATSLLQDPIAFSDTSCL